MESCFRRREVPFRISPRRLPANALKAVGGHTPKAGRSSRSQKRYRKAPMFWSASWLTAKSPMFIVEFGPLWSNSPRVFQKDSSPKYGMNIQQAELMSQRQFPFRSG